MTVTFKNAPLVEIIAELRWGQQPQPAQAPAFTFMTVDSGKLDEFFMRFGAQAFQLKFQRAERIVPPGFPIIPYQPVFRFRNEGGTSLFQVGGGLFTANAIPPYKSWTEFAPVVEGGIGALLQCRGDAEKELPFTSISLRYIDAFKPSLMEGRTTAQFLGDVLGFKVALPERIAAHMGGSGTYKPTLQLSIPLRNSMTMNLTAGEGIVNNNEPSAVLDMTILATGPIDPAVPVAMAVLHEARSIIHSTFVEITKPIHKLMVPVD